MKIVMLLALALLGCGDLVTHRVQGQIVDSSGAPVAHAWVRVDYYWYGCCDGGECDAESGHCVLTDAEGRFVSSESRYSCEPSADVYVVRASGFKHEAIPMGEDVWQIYRCDESEGEGPCQSSGASAGAWCANADEDYS